MPVSEMIEDLWDRYECRVQSYAAPSAESEPPPWFTSIQQRLVNDDWELLTSGAVKGPGTFSYDVLSEVYVRRPRAPYSRAPRESVMPKTTSNAASFETIFETREIQNSSQNRNVEGSKFLV